MSSRLPSGCLYIGREYLQRVIRHVSCCIKPGFSYQDRLFSSGLVLTVIDLILSMLFKLSFYGRGSLSTVCPQPRLRLLPADMITVGP